jgi:16S rRNA (guanine527-N7)-methyltransferase
MLSARQVAQFKEICSGLNISLSDGMVDKFQAYGDLLLDWNKRAHLVSKGDAESSRILRHFVDSLSIFKAVDPPKEAKLLDLGSGAGFPALPIEIVREDLETTLVESVHKKTLFLKKAVQVLRLKRIEVVNQRAQGLADQEVFGGTFDLVTAKAVGKLKYIVSLVVPFLRTGGLLIVYKGKSLESEIHHMGSAVDCRIADIVKIEIPSLHLLRWLVIAEKLHRDSK